MDEWEIYRRIDQMLPRRVDRELSVSLLRGGEPESAIADLLDTAYGDGCLTDEVIALVRSEFDAGPAIEVLDGLEMLEEKNSAV